MVGQYIQVHQTDVEREIWSDNADCRPGHRSASGHSLCPTRALSCHVESSFRSPHQFLGDGPQPEDFVGYLQWARQSIFLGLCWINGKTVFTFLLILDGYSSCEGIQLQCPITAHLDSKWGPVDFGAGAVYQELRHSREQINGWHSGNSSQIWKGPHWIWCLSVCLWIRFHLFGHCWTLFLCVFLCILFVSITWLRLKLSSVKQSGAATDTRLPAGQCLCMFVDACGADAVLQPRNGQLERVTKRRHDGRQVWGRPTKIRRVSAPLRAIEVRREHQDSIPGREPHPRHAEAASALPQCRERLF